MNSLTIRQALEKQGFSGTTGHNFAGGVAEANNFVPIVFCSGIGNDEGTEGDRNAARIRQVRFVTQNLARASDPDRADRPLCFDGGLERAELKGTNPCRPRKGPLGINDHRFATS
jgi:hypothetical protein